MAHCCGWASIFHRKWARPLSAPHSRMQQSQNGEQNHSMLIPKGSVANSRLHATLMHPRGLGAVFHEAELTWCRFLAAARGNGFAPQARAAASSASSSSMLVK